MNTSNFTTNIQFDDNRVKTKVLIETSFSKEIQILMKAGQVMKEHKAPFPILIHLLEGSIELGVQGEKNALKQGDIIALDGGVPHDLLANENSVIRLTLSKQDKAERMENVTRGKD